MKIDINDIKVCGTYLTEEVESLPFGDYDLVEIYPISNKIQVCNIYSAKDSRVRYYRRFLIGDNEFSEWYEMDIYKDRKGDLNV